MGEINRLQIQRDTSREHPESKIQDKREKKNTDRYDAGRGNVWGGISVILMGALYIFPPHYLSEGDVCICAAGVE